MSAAFGLAPFPWARICGWRLDSAGAGAYLLGRVSGRELSPGDTRTVAKLLSPQDDSDIPSLARLGDAPTAPILGVFGGLSGLEK